VADRGIPVYLAPGNHERSAIPFRLLAEHPGIHIFDAPRTFRLTVRGATIALAGFPHVREGIRAGFPEMAERTGWRAAGADAALLCMHQCVEGATVGPGNYTFRSADDVVRGADIPEGLAAVLSGHIHRRQVLTRDLRGGPLRAPVLYPGSIERTSFAEKDEEKGFFILELDFGRIGTPDGLRWTFHGLPARPMAILPLSVEGLNGEDTVRAVQSLLAGIPEDSVARLDIRGRPGPEVLAVLGAASLRALAPPEMNLSVSFPEKYG
jgi:DNA repair exonuclease SbcCD nuclease subunit